jgi:hypothetical protein
MFLSIYYHYTRVERERTTDIPIHPKDIHHRLIIPVSHLSQISRESVAYALSISSQVTLVHVARDARHTDELRANWNAMQGSVSMDEGVKLEIIEPDQRSLARILIEYIESVHREHPTDTLTVILPENYAPWWKKLLRKPTILWLKIGLYFRPNIVATNFVGMKRDHTSDVLTPSQKIQHRFIVPIAGLDQVSKQSLAYARSISSHVTATHVAIDTHDAETVQAAWMNQQKNIAKDEETQLVIIESPYRSLSRPLLAYIDAMRELHPEETLTVLLPEFVVSHWWEFPLHNQTAFQLKTALLSRPSIVVTNIPQHLRKN